MPRSYLHLPSVIALCLTLGPLLAFGALQHGTNVYRLAPVALWALAAVAVFRLSMREKRNRD